MKSLNFFNSKIVFFLFAVIVLTISFIIGEIEIAISFIILLSTYIFFSFRGSKTCYQIIERKGLVLGDVFYIIKKSWQTLMPNIEFYTYVQDSKYGEIKYTSQDEAQKDIDFWIEERKRSEQKYESKVISKS